jgi:hypothetical protein
LQAFAYRDLFYGSLASIAESIKVLIEQKIVLGLLPERASKLLEKADFKDIHAVLAIGAPNMGSKCWSKMQEVYDFLKVATSGCKSFDLSIRLIRDINGNLWIEPHNLK